MALSGAERAKRHRDRLKQDPDRYAKFCEKERNRKQKDYVPAANKTPRERRHMRRHWKKASQKLRDRRKKMLNLPMSPPESPATPPPYVSPPRHIDGRTQRGRKKVKAGRSKAYRQLIMLEKQVESRTSLLEKWKKRYYRSRDENLNLSSTPRSRANKFLNKCKVPPYVRKELVFHNAVIDEIRKKYVNSKENKVKQFLRRTVSNIHKKYGLMSKLSSQIGVNPRLLKNDRCKKLGKYERKTRFDSRNHAMEIKIRDFLSRDDNSRQMPGKKDTITHNKVKKQKRLLNGSMKLLHSKFLYENPHLTTHLSTFCKHRPFWIVKPSMRDLDTCMCKRCTNMTFIHNKLVTEKLIPSSQAPEYLAEIVCDVKSQKCMYGECPECSEKRPKFSITSNPEKTIELQQWITMNKEYVDKNGDKKTTKVTVKDAKPMTLSGLCEKYEAEAKPRYSTHIYNIYHQYRELKKLKERLNENETVVHCDFSENYECRYHEEIQSVHFGGSHIQISLHTGVYYTTGGHTSFCTISPCTRHDPSGIWGHLTPILKKIRTENPNIIHVHFVSDGPTTQYRNKTNFWLTSTIPRTLGFTNVSWNFLEAGHGKGAPDGIGGVIKRTADSIVTQGNDILSAEGLFESLKERTSVYLHLVSQTDIEKFDNNLPALRTVEGTMKIHQLLYPEQIGLVEHRVLSCFCQNPCIETTCKSRLCETPSAPSQVVETTSTSTDVPKPSTSNGVHEPVHEPSTSNGMHGPSTSKSSATCIQSLLQPLNVSNARNEDWCVVIYDGYPYPGQIKDVDEDSVEVSTMSKVGNINNRFFWPRIDDRIWYSYGDVLTIIPPVQKVSSRHHMIDLDIWSQIAMLLDLDNDWN